MEDQEAESRYGNPGGRGQRQGAGALLAGGTGDPCGQSISEFRRHRDGSDCPFEKRALLPEPVADRPAGRAVPQMGAWPRGITPHRQVVDLGLDLFGGQVFAHESPRFNFSLNRTSARWIRTRSASGVSPSRSAVSVFDQPSK